MVGRRFIGHIVVLDMNSNVSPPIYRKCGTKFRLGNLVLCSCVAVKSVERTSLIDRDMDQNKNRDAAKNFLNAIISPNHQFILPIL